LEILAADPVSHYGAHIDELRAFAMVRGLMSLASEIRRMAMEDNMDAKKIFDSAEKQASIIYLEQIPLVAF